MRKQRTAAWIERLIEANDVAGLLAISKPGRCACLGKIDDEPQCVCQMNAIQAKRTVSLPALMRGQIKRVGKQL